jgi:hypothetical protein
MTVDQPGPFDDVAGVGRADDARSRGRDVWTDARMSLGTGAPSLLVGTSGRALDRSTVRLSSAATTPPTVERPSRWVSWAPRRIRVNTGDTTVLDVAVIFLAFAALVSVCFGIGSGRAGVIAIGAVLLVGGPAVLVGVRYLLALRGRSYDVWEHGVGRVVEISDPPQAGLFGSAEMQLTIESPNVDGVTVRVREPAAPVDKWPERGAVLPLMVAVPSLRSHVEWSSVMTHHQAETYEVSRPLEEDQPAPG